MFKFAGYLISFGDQQQFAANRTTAIGFCNSHGIDTSNIRTCYVFDNPKRQFSEPAPDDIIKED